MKEVLYNRLYGDSLIKFVESFGLKYWLHYSERSGFIILSRAKRARSLPTRVVLASCEIRGFIDR